MTTEREVMKACADVLKMCPFIKAWREQSGMVKVRGAWMHLAPNGTADFVGLLRGGRFIGIEVKRSARKGDTHIAQREAQAKWRAEIEALGGVAIVVSSAGELIEKLEALR